MDIIVKRPKFSDKEFNILEFGAKSDIVFNNQKSIQMAIDYCHSVGGGRVIIPDGYYLTGPIKLKSNVDLHLADNAYVQFTKSKEEYPLIFTEYEGIRRIRCISPISAYEATNIAITGKGVIDGNGHLWRGIKQFKLPDKQWQKLLKKSNWVIDSKEGGIWCPTETYYNGVIEGEPDYSEPNALELASKNYDVYRPVLVSLIRCDKVLLDGPTFQNSPAWNVHPLYCTNFTLINANIKNKYEAQNGDGIDLESCQNCEIANTVFETGDDGICVKSGKNKEARKIEIPTKNVWIHDCKVFNAHGGFVIGSEMSRGINNVLVENCVFNGTDIGIRFKSAMGRGGVVENITIRNIYMSRIINEAMIFTMGYVFNTIEDEHEGEVTLDMEDVPEFRNIYMDNILCDSAGIAVKVNGLKEIPIHDIYLKNSYIKADKGTNFSLCKNVVFENVTINTNGEEIKFEKEVFNA